MIADSRILLFDGSISLKWSIQIFGVIPTADRQHRGFDILEMGQQISGLPECVVVWMRFQIIPESDLFMKVECALPFWCSCRG